MTDAAFDMDEKKIALLIDAENTSVKYIDALIEELKKYGVITFQRMYGDFSNTRLDGWNKKALEYAIVPIQQPIYTSGKNAADIMLVIDAMDTLYRKNVDIFCLVSADSDFTRLANRLREDGIFVIGMGPSNASKTFVNACNKYTFLDKIIDEKDEPEDSKKEDSSISKSETAPNTVDEEKDAITPIADIKGVINLLVVEAENKEERANLSSAKTRIQRLYPDFDERNYGYTSFKKFIEEEATKFKIIQEERNSYIVRKNSGSNINLEQKVLEYIKSRAKSDVSLGALGKELRGQFPQFKYKDFGYSSLSKYISSLDGIEIDTKKQTVKLKKG